MRLFIAINFTDEIKDKIQDVITKLKACSTQGRFVKNEHMHITLEFLGDVEENKLNTIQNIMGQISITPFSLKLCHLGHFARREGDIYWIGIEENPKLLNVHSQIHKMLKKEGFTVEDREYKPHLTIGRKILIEKDFNLYNLQDDLEGLEIIVDKIDLLESKQVKGELIHKVIYYKML